jgi:hypothetical protein
MDVVAVVLGIVTYMAVVYTGERTVLDPVYGVPERWLDRVCALIRRGVRIGRGMSRG